MLKELGKAYKEMFQELWECKYQIVVGLTYMVGVAGITLLVIYLLGGFG